MKQSNKVGKIPPKVSVIIPVYNNREYIIDALRSVINQEYKNYEIIIIDDGSVDNSKIMIMDYLQNISHKDVSYYYQANKGVSAARNKGISIAKGEYIAFLDGDDLWLPNKLMKSVEYLEANRKFGMVYSDLYVINSAGEIIGQWFKIKKRISEGNIYENLLRECFILPTNIVIRRECLLRNMFDENIKGVEDIDLWLRLAKKYQIGVIREPLASWRNHDNNCSKNKMLVMNQIIKVFEKQLIGCSAMDKNYKLIKHIIAGKYLALGNYFIGKAMIKNAKQMYSNGIKYEIRLSIIIRLLIAMLPDKLVLAIRKLLLES